MHDWQPRDRHRGGTWAQCAGNRSARGGAGLSRTHRWASARRAAGRGREGNRGAALRGLHDGDRCVRRVHVPAHGRQAGRRLRPHRVRHGPHGSYDSAAAVAWRVDELSARRARAMRPAWARSRDWRSSAPSTKRRWRHSADPLRTRLVLVARAQHSALQEAARTHEELAALGLSRQYLVINGILPAERRQAGPARRGDHRARTRRHRCAASIRCAICRRIAWR